MGSRSSCARCAESGAVVVVWVEAGSGFGSGFGGYEGEAEGEGAVPGEGEGLGTEGGG